MTDGYFFLLHCSTCTLYIVILLKSGECPLQDGPVLRLVHLAHAHGRLTELVSARVSQTQTQDVLEP